MERALELMRRYGFIGEVIQHPHASGKTTEGASLALGVPASQVLKCLLFKSPRGELVGAIVTGDRKVDVKKLRRIFKTGKLRMATPEEVEEATGFKAGGVPPFALKELCPVAVDVEVMEREHVYGAAGSEYAGVKFRPHELLKLGYVVADIAKRPEALKQGEAAGF
ncbi:MAG: hypothetical protein DRN96_09210 [Thermoproteota archaeon]|nr:MAG: hypothetical protein DRN96_09210 [Candidatus Korarchaeota archaeon]RLG55811.1 MAG: hypothetical protein DRN99_01570 [Candidatus Korarchaeota archaeon]